MPVVEFIVATDAVLLYHLFSVFLFYVFFFFCFFCCFLFFVVFFFFHCLFLISSCLRKAVRRDCTVVIILYVYKNKVRQDIALYKIHFVFDKVV